MTESARLFTTPSEIAEGRRSQGYQEVNLKWNDGKKMTVIKKGTKEGNETLTS